MKSFLRLLAVGLLALSASDSLAQTRDLGGNRVVLDDGAGGLLTISYAGPGNSNFIIPPGGATTVPMGSLTGQTLAWSGTEWQAMSNLLNTGGNVSMPTGNLGMLGGIFSLAGGAKPEITPNGITMGQDADLDQGIEIKSQLGSYAYIDFSMNPGVDYDVRLVNSSNDQLMIDGGDLTLNSNDITNVGTITATNGSFTNVSGDGSGLTNVSASSLTLPFSQTASNGSPLFSLTNTTAGAAYFASNNPGGGANALTITTNGSGNAVNATTTGGSWAGWFEISNSGSVSDALRGTTNGHGPGVRGVSTNGPGLHGESVNGRGISASSTNGSSAFFHTGNNANGNPTLHIYNEGTSRAAYFQNTLGSNNDAVLWVNHAGVGRAGVFELQNNANTSVVISASTAGSGAAIWANSASGPAIKMNSGGFIGSFAAIASGATLPTNAMTVFIHDNAGGAATANLPAPGPDGQIIIVTAHDADGLTIAGKSVPNTESILVVSSGGAWKVK